MIVINMLIFFIINKYIDIIVLLINNLTIMSVQPLISSEQSNYGSCSITSTCERVEDLTHRISTTSHKDLAIFMGKVALVALVIAGLVAACVFTGGLAAAGLGVGYSFIKLFALIAASYASGSTAAMLIAGTVFQIFNRIRGVSQEETYQKLNKFYNNAGLMILGSSLILSVVGTPLLLVGFPIYKLITASTPPRAGDIYTKRAEIEMQRMAAEEVARGDLKTSQPRTEAKVSAEQLQFDLLLSKLRLVNTMPFTNALNECSETYRNRVFHHVWNLSVSTRDDSDPQWGEHHCFDDREVLERAVRKAFIEHPSLFS